MKMDSKSEMNSRLKQNTVFAILFVVFHFGLWF